MDVGLATTTTWREARFAATLLRRLLCPCVWVRPFFSSISLEQWENIVRRLDDDRGFQILQVLEQIVEVLEVLPEEIASQFRRLGVEERISERSVEVIEAFPQERISGRTGEQTVRFAHATSHGVCGSVQQFG